MNKLELVLKFKEKLKRGIPSIGTWQQIGSSEISEILSTTYLDWIAVDMEHGSISNNLLPDLFRAIELHGSIPLARIQDKSLKAIKDVLEAGASGVIIPMIENKFELESLIDICKYPPAGKRGVGFCRSNQYGVNFDKYFVEAQSPIVVAMIENKKGLENINSIISCKGLDALMIGPYDLSASLDCCGDFNNERFLEAINKIQMTAQSNNIPTGIHIIKPEFSQIKHEIDRGHLFIAYSLDSVILSDAFKNHGN